MPIISPIGRRHPRVRLLVYSIYTVLTLGAITMVYPFLIMIAGSTKSAVDVSEFGAVPKFFFNETMLYRKHVEGLFNESLDYLNTAYNADVASFESVLPPEEPNASFSAAWGRFLEEAELPSYTCSLGYTQTRVSKTVPQKLREFKYLQMERYDDDIEAFNRAFGTEFVSWNSLFLLPEDYLQRRNKLMDDAFTTAFVQFKEKQPPGFRTYFCVEGFYKRMFLKPQYTREIAEYNRLHGTRHASYDEIHLPACYPVDAPPKVREDWESFVRSTLNLFWVRVEAPGLPLYHDFLKAKYGTIETLNQRYGTDHASFDAIPLIEEPSSTGAALTDWEFFITGWKDPDSGRLHQAPAETLRIHSVENLFREWLVQSHRDAGGINAALGTSFGSTAEILPPQEDFLYFEFLKQRGALRTEFITRNYRVVLDYMLFHGRGVLNTVIYCSLAILLSLIVNPLAAYAMSRYGMPTTYKILLFLLLTMAFPPMVTQIPVFLMLRELGMLNTFAALLLPGVANGYSIFLLKGFFDSLPRELYESAQIDGANEWIMFWNITMALSTPILAVIALNTFTLAYSNFMFALLLCQDQKMWTLMVWLYQLQGRSGTGVIYSSLIIAGVPTLLVFVFCQNIIMRGIVVPVEK
ncbi:MAG: ABC transporter permease subunit [Lentisphaeria bacterium]|nr:ABC transporter permease subunit [Lentisphaeria bacterium]